MTSITIGLSITGAGNGIRVPVGYKILRFNAGAGAYRILRYKDANGNYRTLAYKKEA